MYRINQLDQCVYNSWCDNGVHTYDMTHDSGQAGVVIIILVGRLVDNTSTYDGIIDHVDLYHHGSS